MTLFIEIADILTASDLRLANTVFAQTGAFESGALTAGRIAKPVKNNEQAKATGLAADVTALIEKRLMKNDVFRAAAPGFHPHPSLALQPGHGLRASYGRCLHGRHPCRPFLYAFPFRTGDLRGRRADRGGAVRRAPGETAGGLGGALSLDHAPPRLRSDAGRTPRRGRLDQKPCAWRGRTRNAFRSRFGAASGGGGRQPPAGRPAVQGSRRPAAYAAANIPDR